MEVIKEKGKERCEQFSGKSREISREKGPGAMRREGKGEVLKRDILFIVYCVRVQICNNKPIIMYNNNAPIMEEKETKCLEKNNLVFCCFLNIIKQTSNVTKRDT